MIEKILRKEKRNAHGDGRNANGNNRNKQITAARSLKASPDRDKELKNSRFGRDFRSAGIELCYEQVLKVSPQGDLSLKIPVRDALAIAKDKATDLMKTFLLCYVMECESESNSLSPDECRQITDIMEKLRPKMGDYSAELKQFDEKFEREG